MLHAEETETGADFQKRERIIRTATEAFFAHGYENANLQHIAEAAGVGKLTIYRFFKDKADLFNAVILEGAKYISDPLRDIFDPDRDVYDNLVTYSTLYTQRLLHKICDGHRYFEIIRLMLPHSIDDPEVSAHSREIFRINLFQPIVNYFQSLIDCKIFRQEDPEFLALTFNQLAFLSDIANFNPNWVCSPEDIEQNAKRVASLFVKGAMQR